MTEIIETPVTGIAGKRTPREALEKPLTRKKKEPAFLIDVSGSNLEFAAPDSDKTKVELVCETIGILTPILEKDDAEAAREQAGGSSEKGGVRAVAANEPGDIEFEPGEDESDDPRDLHDINTANLKQKQQQIRDLVNQQGRTYLMPGVRALQHAFNTEFKGDLDRCLEIVIVTDGKLHDPKEFEAWLDKNAGPNCVVCVAVIGYGPEHDKAVEHYQEIAKRNKFVTVDALTGVSDPMEVAYDLQFMADLAA